MNRATAKGHLAGKLSIVLYSMLKNNENYDEEKHRKSLNLPKPKEPLTKGEERLNDESVEISDDEIELLDDLSDLDFGDQ